VQLVAAPARRSNTGGNAMRSCYVLALALVGLGACGDKPGSDDGGNTIVDMAAGGGNGDGGGIKPDFAMPDLKPPLNSLHVFWDMWNKFKQGEPMNMLSQTCMESGATEIKFWVRNGSNAEETTTVPCPAGSKNGDTYVKTPDTTGPYTVCATLPGKGMSVSYKVMGVAFGSEPNISIFADGCTETKCMCP
jgi:hypothetical protein